MTAPRRSARSSRRARLRALLAGLVLLGAVGSCELPKPQIPSIGGTPSGPAPGPGGTAAAPWSGARRGA